MSGDVHQDSAAAALGDAAPVLEVREHQLEDGAAGIAVVVVGAALQLDPLTGRHVAGVAFKDRSSVLAVIAMLREAALRLPAPPTFNV